MQSEFFVSGKDIVSVAVEIGSEKHLRKLNQNEPLTEIVQSLCTEFHVSKDSGRYALQFMNDNGGENKYVTEENRSEIKNGSILRLVLSPSEIANMIVKNLQPDASDTEEKEWALDKVSTLSADPVFAKAFLACNGFKTIMLITLNISEPPARVTCCLQSMMWLLHHHLIPALEENILRRLVEFINSEVHLPVELIECCLILLEKTVKQKKHTSLGFGIPDLMQHLWNREYPKVQERALALINALAQSTDQTKILGLMVSRQIRDTIHKNILSYKVSHAMAHQLYVYQTLILGLLENNVKTKIDPTGVDARVIEEISNILASAKEDMQNIQGSIASLSDETQNQVPLSNTILSKKQFFKGEFVCSTAQPVKTLRKASYVRSKSTPPPDIQQGKKFARHSLVIDFPSESSSSTTISKLTLNCIFHFARRYHRTFVQVVLEEEALSQPFPSTCEDLVRLLCELLSIGKAPTRDGELYQPMVFTATGESPFMEELFCRAALLMGRTRREMKARTPRDMEKVMRVVKRQLQEALNLKPVSLEKLDEVLRKFPYSVIAEIWQSEREEKEKKQLEECPPILQLKQECTKTILELIEQQRINILLRGAKFPKYTARGQRVKKKSWFACLSKNQRVFHYGDCDDEGRVMLDHMSQISVSDIKTLVTGKKCPHIRENRSRKPDSELVDLSFSITFDEKPFSLDFVAPDEKVFDYWTDGINCLLGQAMTSATKESELKMLLDIEIRLQLLDTEGIPIPNKAPPIPSDPPNYNFSCK